MEDIMVIATNPMASQAWPKFMWFVVLAAAIGCVIGFKEFIWFLSVGYGFAVAAIGCYLTGYTIAANGLTNIVPIIVGLLFVAYGLRLGIYTLNRELKSASYKKTLDSTGSTKKVPVFVSLFVWVFVSFLYASQTSSLSYRLINGASDNIWGYVGAVIMALAIIGEATSDKQKSAAKKINPKRFCDTGLFKFCRCPNYFCEMMFWVGTVVSGIGSTSGKQWIVVVIGLVCIIYIMVDGAKRLELRHEKNYGLDLEYVKYSDTVPLLIPFIGKKHSMKVYRD